MTFQGRCPSHGRVEVDASALGLFGGSLMAPCDGHFASFEVSPAAELMWAAYGASS